MLVTLDGFIAAGAPLFGGKPKAKHGQTELMANMVVGAAPSEDRSTKVGLDLIADW